MGTGLRIPAAAVAQLTANAQTILRVLPPGITPPLILQYSASIYVVLPGNIQAVEDTPMADGRGGDALAPHTSTEGRYRMETRTDTRILTGCGGVLYVALDAASTLAHILGCTHCLFTLVHDGHKGFRVLQRGTPWLDLVWQ